MKTIIHIFSKIGHTPLTNRGGSFCDELLKTEVDAQTPEEAKAIAKELFNETPHANKGHFYMPEFPNQNTRAQWFGRE